MLSTNFLYSDSINAGYQQQILMSSVELIATTAALAYGAVKFSRFNNYIKGGTNKEIKEVKARMKATKLQDKNKIEDNKWLTDRRDDISPGKSGTPSLPLIPYSQEYADNISLTSRLSELRRISKGESIYRNTYGYTPLKLMTSAIPVVGSALN